MDLHRAPKIPQWETMAPESWNYWQRLAHRSNSWLTPGNFVTLAGNILTFYGIYEIAWNHWATGIIAISLGRLGDFVDGRVAARTLTKSPLGEALDAGFDKFQIVAAAPVLITQHVIPATIGIVIVAEQFIISGIVTWARSRGHIMHPSVYGKFATGSGWIALIFLTIAASLREFASTAHLLGLGQSLRIIGYIVVACSIAFGIMTIRGYSKSATKTLTRKKTL